MIHDLHEMLGVVRSRVRKLRWRWALAICWLSWAAIAGLLWGNADHLQLSGAPLVATVAIGALVTAGVCRLLVSRSTRDSHAIAQRIETKHPELGAALLAALEQAPSPRFRRLGYLQSAVVREAVSHGRSHDWNRDVPSALLIVAQVVQLGTFGLLVTSCLLLLGRGTAIARSAGPEAGQSKTANAIEGEVEVSPGNADIERGTALLVVAEFGSSVPAEANLLMEAVGKATASDFDPGTRPMTRSLDDPKFVARVPTVRDDFNYAVAYSGRQTERYRVTVFDYPALVRADAKLAYPPYTALEPKLVEDVRHLTAVEGTELTLRCRLNKEVQDARLVDRAGEELPLARTADEVPIYTASLVLADSRRFKLHLTDHQGRHNKLPPDLVVNVTPNRPAKLKIARPVGDVRVSPIEELDVSGEVSDDFGLLRYGVSYAMGGNEPQAVVLFDSGHQATPTHKKKASLSHTLDFEALDAEPDQLLAYYVWAEDFGADGEPRQVMSDMYFAEVRHFEEIFRQGEQPTEQQMQEAQQQQAQQGGEPSQQAAELAELQKQIINATWGLVRREKGSELSATFTDDVEVIAASQQQAMDQLETLAGEVTDAESQQHVEQARQEMQSAVTRLSVTAETTEVAGLRPALSAEQAAYQALLKLRAREFSIVEGRPQQQGTPSSSASGANSRSQQQLNQLELSSDENRYETQSRAADQREQAQQIGTDEARQVLDRLRELARRQEDLNERVRQLQSELEAAESETQREQIERELKRLREQQQEILRDTDQLQSDMQNSENSEQTQDAQQQLEQTRSRVRQASDALEEGRLSEAVNEGTRAGRELNELRDEFRRRTADRFSDEMRNLRDAARQLNQRQQHLDETLSQQRAQKSRSLRDGGDRQEVLEGLAEQQQQYEELIERMQETVQEAEEPEPLLARQLFETVRQATDDQVAEALGITQQLLDVGIEEEASETMRTANRGIGRLRDGVDRAAESVLGDDAEALRRAERELEDLEEQLNREIRDARGEDNPSRRGDEQLAQSGDGRQQQRRAAPETEAESPAGDGARAAAADVPPADEESGQPPSNRNEPSERGEGGRRSGDAQENQDPQRASQSSRQPSQDGEQQPGGANRDNPPPQQDAEEGRGGRQSDSMSDRRGGGSGGGLPRDLAEFLEDWSSAPAGPITGEDFREWNDRLRDVQDLLDDPELRTDVARIRDRAEEARADFKRRAKEPDWENLINMVAQPLAEVRARIREEIRRKESPDALVPIDRDPVPVEYVEAVQEYYQRLGSGE